MNDKMVGVVFLLILLFLIWLNRTGKLGQIRTLFATGPATSPAVTVTPVTPGGGLAGPIGPGGSTNTGGTVPYGPPFIPGTTIPQNPNAPLYPGGPTSLPGIGG